VRRRDLCEDRRTVALRVTIMKLPCRAAHASVAAMARQISGSALVRALLVGHSVREWRMQMRGAPSFDVGMASYGCFVRMFRNSTVGCVRMRCRYSPCPT
jgi:hypothetical protein